MEVFAHVPVWVWFVLAYGLGMGIKGFGTRKVSLAMATLLPVVFLGLSLSSLWPVVAVAPAIGLVWLLALGAGGIVGWFFLSSEPVEVHRHRGTLVVPGTWTVLVLFVVVFATKFVYGTISAVAPVVAAEGGVLVAVFSLSGLATGIVTGRTARLYNRYFGTPVSEGE